jgi:3-oxoacyl-[acyl-carrier protein] reductase
MQDVMQKLFDLNGKTALVTGASSGLGWAFAQALAAAGASVVVGARRADRLKELCDEIEANGGLARTVELDVTDVGSISGAFDAAESSFGVVDVVVNNAGIRRAGNLLRMEASDWDSILDTNLKAVWQVAAEATRRMVAAEHAGSIINIASVLAFGTGKSLGPYMASKAGVVHLTRSMALEWAGKNVRINALAPGYFPFAL